MTPHRFLIALLALLALAIGFVAGRSTSPRYHFVGEYPRVTRADRFTGRVTVIHFHGEGAPPTYIEATAP